MSYLIPTSIASARLVLDIPREEDWVPLHGYYSDPESVRYTFQQPLAGEETRRVVASLVRHWQRRGYGPYVLRDNGSGTVVGLVGLWFPKAWPETEIKWAVLRGAWGKGYASEAVRAVQAMAARHLPNLQPISLIHAENARSIQLAQAVGAALEKEIDFRGGVFHVYRHPRAGTPATG